MKNSVHTNLIVMDEMLDSALDEAGMSLCFDLIRGMTKSNIFVVSHREAIADKFEHTIKLIKKNNFTEIDK
jgi:ABC-type lipoprotein export system ATPase subunit